MLKSLNIILCLYSMKFSQNYHELFCYDSKKVISKIPSSDKISHSQQILRQSLSKCNSTLLRAFLVLKHLSDFFLIKQVFRG